MTIEIKQLVIRAVVEERRERAPGGDPPRSGAAPGATPTPALARRAPAPAPDSTGRDREALIAECTRRVLRELARGRGR
jgi:hypothetical protein